MKWPLSITLIRHAQSQYNILRTKKEQDPEYEHFKALHGKDPDSPLARVLAGKMQSKYALDTSDYKTPLSTAGVYQARDTGRRIFAESVVPVPDVILVSPYVRTRTTLNLLKNGAGETHFTKAVEVVDERIREQEHGLSLLYNDWRIFEIMHPEQRMLRKLQGPYWYQFPQGESVAQVRDRIRSMTSTIIREYRDLHVWLVTHHLTILSIRANFERLSPEDFIHLDEHEKPVNCGITIYRGDPQSGGSGKMQLELYNKSLY